MYSGLTNKKHYKTYRVDKAKQKKNHERAATMIFEDIESGELIKGQKDFCEKKGIKINRLHDKIKKSRMEIIEQPIEVNGRLYKYSKTK